MREIISKAIASKLEVHVDTLKGAYQEAEHDRDRKELIMDWDKACSKEE